MVIMYNNIGTMNKKTHRAMTEMDGLVTEGDKPEAGGNIEADNKGRED